MASIVKRGEKWQARIVRKDSAPVFKSFKSKVDAETWARRIEADLDRGIALGRVESERVTLV